jgi:hypothetical protein
VLQELKQHKPWFDEMFMIFRSKEAGEKEVDTGYKPKQCI